MKKLIMVGMLVVSALANASIKDAVLKNMTEIYNDGVKQVNACPTSNHLYIQLGDGTDTYMSRVTGFMYGVNDNMAIIQKNEYEGYSVSNNNGNYVQVKFPSQSVLQLNKYEYDKSYADIVELFALEVARCQMNCK